MSVPEWKYEPAHDSGMPIQQSLRSERRETGLGAFTTQTAWRSATWMYLRLFHRLRVRGREHLPSQPPFVLVANHTSHLDALTLAAALPWRLRSLAFPIAAGDAFFDVEASAWFAAMMLNALPMWRGRAGRHAMLELRTRLCEQKCIFILFPEGTRARDGCMATFKPGIGMLVAGTDVAVVPCHLSGAFAALPPQRRLPRPVRLELSIGPPRSFAQAANERHGWEQVASEVEGAVRALATPRG